MTNCDRTTSGRGSSIGISLSHSRHSKNTINTHEYSTIYWCSSISYYKLGLCFKFTKDWSAKYASKDNSEFAEAISLNIQNILFALKENAIHQSSKPENPSTESIPPRFGLPTNNPHRHQSPKRGSMSSPAHRRQQEQMLIDYAPQDLSMVIKGLPLDMQRLLIGLMIPVGLLAPRLSTISLVN
jgi:hypothetical protein